MIRSNVDDYLVFLLLTSTPFPIRCRTRERLVYWNAEVINTIVRGGVRRGNSRGCCTAELGLRKSDVVLEAQCRQLVGKMASLLFQFLGS